MLFLLKLMDKKFGKTERLTELESTEITGSMRLTRPLGILYIPNRQTNIIEFLSSTRLSVQLIPISSWVGGP